METTAFFLSLLEKLSPLLALLLLGGVWLIRFLVKQADELKEQNKEMGAELKRVNEARIAERDQDREVLRDVAGVLERVHTDVRDHDGKMTVAVRDSVATVRQHVTEQVERLRP